MKPPIIPLIGSTNFNPVRNLLRLALGVALVASVPSSQAASYTWDPTLSPATPAGGAGTWDLSGANWSNGSTDSVWTDSNGTTSTAVFSGTAGTVTIGSSLGALGLVFNTTGYALTGGTLSIGTGGISAGSLSTGTTSFASGLNLAGSQSWNVGSGATLSVGGVISGTGALTTTGAGTVILTAANTFTGALAVNAGILQINNGAIATSNNIGLTGGAIYQSGATSSVSTSVGGSVALTIGGNGSSAPGGYGYYSLSSGTLSITGNTTSGQLEVGGNSSSSSAAIGILDMSGGTASSASHTQIARGNGGASFGLLNVTGGSYMAGTVIQLAGANANSVGVLNVGGGSGPASVTALGTGAVSANNGLDLSNKAVSATGVVNLLSSGTLTVSQVANNNANANTYLNFNGGTLKALAGTTVSGSFLGGASQNVANVIVYGNGGMIDNNGQSITISNPLRAASGSGVSSVTINSGGSGYIGAPEVIFTGGGGAGATGYATINPATGAVTGIVITSPGTGYTSAPTVTLTGGGGSGVTFSGTAIAANTAGGMTFQGAGTTILSGANTYAGATTVSAGTLQVGNGTSGSLSSSSSLSVSNGATLAFNVVSGTIGNNISNAGTVAGAEGAGITDTLAGVISSTGGFTQSGAGTTVLTATNSYSGPTTISAGTLSIGGAGNLGSGAYSGNISNSGTFNYASSAAQTLSGVISGTGALSKNGTGTLTLSNINTYTGGTIVNSGTLVLANGGGTGAIRGTLTINSGGVVSATVLDAIGWNGSSSVVSQLNINGGLFDIATASSNGYITNVAMTGGTMTSTGGGAFNIGGASGMSITSNSSATTSLISAPLQLRDGNTTTFNVASGASNGVDLLISGNFSFASGCSLLKTGAGNLALTGAAFYTGTTTISAGTLQIGNSGTTGSLSTASAIVDNASLVIKRSNSVSQGTDFSNTISGTGSLTQAGSGTLTIADTTGTNTYSGGTYVNAGELKVTFSGSTAQTVAALGTGAITVNGGLLHFVPSGNVNTSYAIANNVVLNGGSIFSEDANLLLGGSTSASTNTIAVNSPTTLYREWGHVTGKSLQLNGILQGSAALTLSGTLGNAGEGGSVWINNPNNTYSGTVTVNANTGSGGFAMVVGNNTALQYANVNLSGTSAGSDSAINTGGVQFAGGVTAPVLGSLAGNGNIALVNGSSQAVSLSVGGNNSTTAFSGVLSGGGSLTKTGTGTLTLSNNNTYTGSTAINAGKLIVSGSLSASSTSTVGVGATLASGNNLTSKVGSVNVISDNTGFGGTLAVGDTQGTLGSIGKLTVNGSLTLGNASTTGTAHLAMEIGGTTAGTGYDQIAVTGALNLTNVQLDGSFFGYTPVNSTDTVSLSNGDRFYLVIGASSHTGQFANQNAADPYSAGNPTITFGGQEFAIIYTANYNGGTNSTLTGGNDIALVAIPEPGTWVMMISGIGLLSFWQRARRRSA